MTSCCSWRSSSISSSSALSVKPREPQCDEVSVRAFDCASRLLTCELQPKTAALHPPFRCFLASDCKEATAEKAAAEEAATEETSAKETATKETTATAEAGEEESPNLLTIGP